jgi:hypothetical protein
MHSHIFIHTHFNFPYKNTQLNYLQLHHGYCKTLSHNSSHLDEKSIPPAKRVRVQDMQVQIQGLQTSWLNKIDSDIDEVQADDEQTIKVFCIEFHRILTTYSTQLIENKHTKYLKGLLQLSLLIAPVLHAEWRPFVNMGAAKNAPGDVLSAIMTRAGHGTVVSNEVKGYSFIGTSYVGM